MQVFRSARYYSDPDEDVNDHNQMKLVDKAASHMVSPGIFLLHPLSPGTNGGGSQKPFCGAQFLGFRN